MIRLIQRKLIIPRGDSGSFAIPPIASSEDAIAVFAILDPSTNRKVFSKIIEDVAETINVSFTHDETVNLPCGKFLWDIKYYTEPIIVDGELIGGTEVDSYYAAYTMPECEVRQTADNLLTADGSPETTLTPDAIDAITAALNEIDSKMAEIEEISGHAPIIQNGEWYIWDTDTGDYIDSGVSATGPEGPQGETGQTGETGAPGPKGDPGEGVPTGGAEGDVLTKSGAADYATEWAAPAVTAAQFAALQQQVDALYPTKSVGPAAVVAVDDALAGNAQGLTVAIEPVQAGSGDPSPENVRPIYGWTGANVPRTGKNLLKYPLEYSDLTPTFNKAFRLKPGTYTISFSDTTATSWRYAIKVFDFNGNTQSTGAELTGLPWRGASNCYLNEGSTTAKSLTITTVYDGMYSFCMMFGDASISTVFSNAQLELGSTATAYEPYTGTTYSIAFPSAAGTVYGGTRNVVTGVLTVDRAYETITKDGAWYSFATGTGNSSAVIQLTDYQNVKYVDGTSSYNGAISSTGKEAANYWVSARQNEVPNEGDMCFAYSTGGQLRVHRTDVSTITDLASFKANFPDMQICYHLATPITYQLTPQQIDLLRGNNTVWADTGDVTLNYKQDIALLLSKLDSTT